MKFSNRVMSLVPGKTSYIVFDGESQKGYWPKYKKFCVLDKSLNPEDYKGGYICSLKKRYNRKYQPFYIVTPVIEIPDYSVITDINRDYTKSSKKLFYDLLSDMGMELSNYYFRLIIVMECIKEFNSSFSKEDFDKVYFDSQRIWKLDSNPDYIGNLFYNKGLSYAMMVNFFRVFYSWFEDKKYYRIAYFLRMMQIPRSVEGIPFWIIPDDPNVEVNKPIKEEYDPNNSNYARCITGTAVFTNLECKRVSITSFLLAYRDKCINFTTCVNRNSNEIIITPKFLFKNTNINKSIESLKDRYDKIQQSGPYYDWILSLDHTPFLGNPKRMIIN